MKSEIKIKKAAKDLFKIARKRLIADGKLHPTCFFIKEVERGVSVGIAPIMGLEDNMKDELVAAIEEKAKETSADAVFFIFEGWSKTLDSHEEGMKQLEEYKEVRNIPGNEECLMGILSLSTGEEFAASKIHRSENTIKLGKTLWGKAQEMEGRLSNMMEKLN